MPRRPGWPGALYPIEIDSIAISLSIAVPAMQNLPSESSPCNTIAPSEGLAEHSRFFQRLHRRYEQDLPLLPPGAPTRALMEQTLSALRARGTDMASARAMQKDHWVARALLVVVHALGMAGHVADVHIFAFWNGKNVHLCSLCLEWIDEGCLLPSYGVCSWFRLSLARVLAGRGLWR